MLRILSYFDESGSLPIDLICPFFVCAEFYTSFSDFPTLNSLLMSCFCNEGHIVLFGHTLI